MRRRHLRAGGRLGIVLGLILALSCGEKKKKAEEEKKAPAPAALVAAPAPSPSLRARNEAALQVSAGHFDVALKLLDDAVAHAPPEELAAIKCDRAAVLSQRGARAADEKARERDFRSAVSDCPGEAVLQQGLAEALVMRARGLGDGAEQRTLRRALLEEAMKLKPSVAAAVDLAQLCDVADDPVCAAAAAEKALELQPNDARLLALRDRLKRHGDVEGSFKSARHQHFTAKFEGYGEERLAWGALDVLEQHWFAIGSALDLHPVEPITVVIYTGEQYKQATNTPDWSAGVFDGKIRIREGTLAAERGSLEDTLIHEYVHAALRNCVPGEIPPWFHEGLAQHFEKKKPDARAWVQHAGGKASAAALATPFVKHDEKTAQAAYSTALWMVETLSAKRGNYGLQQLLAEMKRGSSFDAALQSAFATTTEGLLSSLE